MQPDGDLKGFPSGFCCLRLGDKTDLRMRIERGARPKNYRAEGLSFLINLLYDISRIQF